MADFSITKRNENDIEFVSLHGYLDAHTAQDLEKSIADSVAQGSNKLIVNFKNLEYISSAGLGVFMVFIEDVRNATGDIKLTEMQPKVYTVFDLLGFHMLFDILETDEAAITKFGESNS